MNIDKALDKKHEASDFPTIGDAPPSALQGLASRVNDPLKQIGINNITEMGQFVFYKRAKAITHLASFEVPDGRAANSNMNLEDIVKKKDSKLLLSAIADSPISILKGVTTKFEKTLTEFLHVKTVRDLAESKYFACAESFAVLVDVKTGKDPVTPSKPPAAGQSQSIVVAGVVAHSPNQLVTLQLEDYKTTLQSLNGRLKFYIDEIRARDETIVELNALLFKLKQSHVAELDRVDTQYKSSIQVMETKVGQVHQQDVQRLQQLVAKAQTDFEKEIAKSALSRDAAKAMTKERDLAVASLAVVTRDLNDLQALHHKELQRLQLAAAKAQAELEKEVEKNSAANKAVALKTKELGHATTELVTLTSEMDELRKQLEAGRKAAVAAESMSSQLQSTRAALEAKLAVQVASVEAKERALAHSEQTTLNAVAAAHSIHKEENKRTREAMLLTMHKELDAVRKKLTTDHNQERAEAKAAAAVLRESLEAELRRTSALLADAEQKAEGTSREMTEVLTLYRVLKERYERECGVARMRIAELDADVKSSEAARLMLQGDYTTLCSGSATIVQEIDRYNVLLSQEESRIGIISSPTPASASASDGRGKRRRTNQEPSGYLTGSGYITPGGAPTGSPPVGFLGSVRKLTGL